ncbi:MULTISPECIES: hypothetical protein [Mycobacterium]|uniref:Uncharacterized protein n=1 Tax=Mycobacterium talmoniae TaxID=1858794 RepID=A0A1S1NFX5_9MYCO|nr:MULTISPECIES: hypothetical protein [Mycobacterium]OHV02773.1 hypothetical protein BKN37_15680 [Mycobacterium talmoniae]PQM45283.1 hypothetical protein C1Y40_04568 [Mycobacterium talmoniae]TDH48800.1 hypothetical protein E2F47_22495 [Mycobacterium eburneum]
MEHSSAVGNDHDNDSGLAVSVPEALAAFRVARQHAENADRIFRSIEDEQHAMAANWSGSAHGSYMNASMSYNDEASEITKGLFNFITVSEEGVQQIHSHDDA